MSAGNDHGQGVCGDWRPRDTRLSAGVNQSRPVLAGTSIMPSSTMTRKVELALRRWLIPGACIREHFIEYPQFGFQAGHSELKPVVGWQTPRLGPSETFLLLASAFSRQRVMDSFMIWSQACFRRVTRGEQAHETRLYGPDCQQN